MHFISKSKKNPKSKIEYLKSPKKSGASLPRMTDFYPNIYDRGGFPPEYRRGRPTHPSWLQTLSTLEKLLFTITRTNYYYPYELLVIYY